MKNEWNQIKYNEYEQRFLKPHECFDRVELRGNYLLWRSSTPPPGKRPLPEIPFDHRTTELTAAQIEALAKGSAGDYSGNMSPATRRRVSKMLMAYLSIFDHARRSKRACPYYPTFLTLTFPVTPDRTDAQVKREYLGQFIQRAKREWNVQNYFWRAEPQKSGRIHFHIILDRYVPKEKIREVWCECIPTEVKEWQKSKGKTTLPPCTEIESLKDIRSAAAYGCKYMTKSTLDQLYKSQEYKSAKPKAREKLREQWEVAAGRKIQGRVWGCSDAIRDLPPYSISAWHMDLGRELSRAVLKLPKKAHYTTAHCVVTRVTDGWLQKNVPEVARQQSEFYRDLGKMLYNNTGTLSLKHALRAFERCYLLKDLDKSDFLLYICESHPVRWLKTHEIGLHEYAKEAIARLNSPPGTSKSNRLHRLQGGRRSEVCQSELQMQLCY